MAKEYNPMPRPITRAQACRVAQQYSSSAALLIFSFTGAVEGEYHRRQLLRIVERLYGAVKRGKGYCLNRSQLANLYSGITRTRELDITPQQAANYINGALLQDAFPNLSADDREFIISGITPEEWDAAFGGDEE